MTNQIQHKPFCHQKHDENKMWRLKCDRSVSVVHSITTIFSPIPNQTFIWPLFEPHGHKSPKY